MEKMKEQIPELSSLQLSPGNRREGQKEESKHLKWARKGKDLGKKFIVSRLPRWKAEANENEKNKDSSGQEKVERRKGQANSKKQYQGV